MKRTYPANIDGQIFYIDEDAYLMLQDYLLSLKNTFKGTEGAEIVGDIESRIRELFNERIATGASVIVRADVTSVIETMGRPEQLSDESCDTDERTQQEASGQPGQPGEENRPFIEINLPSRKRLYRNMKNKVFGGVLGGVAMYLGWNANILRLFYAIVSCCSPFGFHLILPMTIVYLLAWMIIPPALNPRQILEMKGAPVNVDTVGQEFMANNPSAYDNGQQEEPRNFFSLLITVIGKVLLGFVGLIGSIAFIGSLIGFITIGICLICLLFHIGPVIPENIIPWWWQDGMGIYASTILVWCLVGTITGGALAWTASCSLFNARPASKTVIITTFIMEIILISIGIVLSIIAASL